MGDDANDTSDPSTSLQVLRRDIDELADEAAFDRLTRLASHAFQVQTAALALWEGDHVRIVSRAGPVPRFLQERSASGPCRGVVARREPVLVADSSHPDATAGELLRQAGVAAYLGVPVRTPREDVVGSLFLLHDVPRTWSAEDVRTLEAVSAAATTELELRLEIRQREAAERQLRESEQRLRTVFDGLGAVVHVVDGEGRIQYINPAARSVLGYEPEELVGKHAHEFVHPEDRPLAMSTFDQEVANAPSMRHLDLRIRHRDGSWRAFEVLGRTTFDSAGEVIAVVTSYDVTERVRTVEALRETEERLRMILEQIPAIMWSTDVDLRITFSRGGGLAQVGLKDMELAGTLLQDYLGGEDATLVFESAQAALRGESSSYDNQWRGRSYRVYMHPHRSADGTITGTVGMALDVTETRVAAQAVRSSQSLLQATLDSTADGILVVDREGRVTSYNQQFADMWRLSPEALRMRDDGVLLAKVLEQLADPDEFLRRVREVYERPEDVSLNDIRFKDGRIFERYSRPQRVGGDIVGRVWSFRDVTELKQLEEQVRRAQKLDAVGRLAGGIAHDFNNLLTAMRGRIDMACAQAGDAPIRADLDEVSEAIGRAATLTRQLLAFSRQQMLERRVLDANEIVEGMHRLLRRLIGEDIELEVQLDPDAGRVLGDRGQLEQVILNLAVNARDAMPRGGRLTLTTRKADAQHLEVEVRDDGEGMTEETRRRIFEPFFTTKPPGKGTGLGLATVYGIVHQSGGEIRVHSAVGEGAVFTIRLPREAAELDAPEAAEPAAEAPAGGATVLLVEDEPLVRSVVRRVLEGEGYVVLEAEDGSAAISLADAHPDGIDLLLSDVVMPGMSGYELARRLAESHPGTKTLLMSGYAEESAQPGSTDEADLIMKPFTPAELLRRVQAILRSLD